MEFLREIGIPDAKLSINTRGVMPDRGPAGQLLRDYFGSRIHEMCDDCKARLERNVWRILDCKQEACRKFVADAPDYVASFSAESRAYFDEVKAALTALGVEYTVDPLLVRGLDYYVHTVFEVTHTGLGAQTAIAGGGRYELFLPGQNRPVQGVGAAARMANLKLAGELRRAGMKVALELEERSFKAQLRSANKAGASFTVVRGEAELEKKIAMVKTMADGSQSEVPEAGLFDTLLKLTRQSAGSNI